MGHDILSRMARRERGPFTSEVRTALAPAAGADFSIRVPAGQAWNVRAVRARLITSAVVANRAPDLRVGDQTSIAADFPLGTVLAASLTTDITWVADLGVVMVGTVGNRITVPMGPVVLQAGWELTSNTALIDVGDQWSAITVWLDRMDSPPRTLNQELGIPIDEIMGFLAEHVQEGL